MPKKGKTSEATEKRIRPYFLNPPKSNVRFDVSGQVTLGKDGFVEICLVGKSGERIHMHRYPPAKKGGTRPWDFFLQENGISRKVVGLSDDGDMVLDKLNWKKNDKKWVLE